MPWLQLRSGTRGAFPAPALATGQVGVSQAQATQDGATVLLDSSDSRPPPAARTSTG